MEDVKLFLIENTGCIPINTTGIKTFMKAFEFQIKK